MIFYVSIVAYLDPGTGSMLLQAIVGGSAGLYIFFRHIWRTFRFAKVKIEPIDADDLKK